VSSSIEDSVGNEIISGTLLPKISQRVFSFQHLFTVLNNNYQLNLLLFEAQINLAGATADMAPAIRAPDLSKTNLKMCLFKLIS